MISCLESYSKISWAVKACVLTGRRCPAPLNLIQFIVPDSHNGLESGGSSCASDTVSRRSSIYCGRSRSRSVEAWVRRRPAAVLGSVTSAMTDEASMGHTGVKRCKDLEKENGRLRQIVSDLELDKSMLKEALDFLGHRG